MPIAEVCAGSLDYGSGDTCKRILHDVWLSVEAGEIVAILGASGSGKSSLLRVLCGLEVLGSGSARVLGGRPLDMLRSGRVAIASSDAALLPWRDARGNARLPLDLLGRDRRQGDLQAEALLSDVFIAELAERRPSELSDGQVQRLKLAQALATRPDLLLLDEPFSNADEGLRHVLAQMILRYVRAQPGRSAILVTHSAYEAAAIADRVIVVTGLPLREIYHEPVPEERRGGRTEDDVMSVARELRTQVIAAAREYGGAAHVSRPRPKR